MSNRATIEKTRDDLIAKAQTIRDRKNAEAKAKNDQILEKAQAIYDKQMNSAQQKYDEFVAKVEEDTGKRLGIVNKVIEAESEERVFKEKQAQREVEMKQQREAEEKMRQDAEAARAKEEAKQKRIAEKKAAKAKAKEMALRAKVPIPPGFVACANSKKLYAKLKKINSAGRYGFCCFYMSKKGKAFTKFINELVAEFNTNVAWFDCPIKDQNFEEAMLLYEFNATPAVVVCKEGKPSNLHRYVIGLTDDSKATLRRYAEKADAE
eukprot:198952_1